MRRLSVVGYKSDVYFRSIVVACALGLVPAAALAEPTAEFEASLKVRAGLWVGGLSPGLFSTMAASEVTQPEGSAIGRGSGLVSELGISATLGDWDFAFTFLTDELIGAATADVDDIVSRTVLRQILGELRSRVFDALIGTEISASVRAGSFSGPVDGSKFGFRDNQVWFGSTNDQWDTDYLSLQLGARIETAISDFIYVRYSHFSTPQIIEVIAVRPVGIQTTTVDAVGVGFQVGGEIELGGPLRLGLDFSTVPMTGLARLDYGSWGQIWGPLFEFETTLYLEASFDIGGAFKLEPYAGFRADMLSPLGGSFEFEDASAPSLLSPDFLLWGPVFGLEVVL